MINRQTGSSRKRIGSVLHSLVHSFFSMMNSPVDDLIFDIMKKNNIAELKVFFSDRKIEPEGEYDEEIWSSIDDYMEWLPKLARSQNVDSARITDIIATVTKETDGYRISVTALDDRDMQYAVKVR